jgi:hypothetical protein
MGLVWQRVVVKHCPEPPELSPRKDCHPVYGLQHEELPLQIEGIEQAQDRESSSDRKGAWRLCGVDVSSTTRQVPWRDYD